MRVSPFQTTVRVGLGPQLEQEEAFQVLGQGQGQGQGLLIDSAALQVGALWCPISQILQPGEWFVIFLRRLWLPVTARPGGASRILGGLPSRV